MTDDLEPAAWEYDCVVYDGHERREAKSAEVERHPEWPGEEPLVRISDLPHLVEFIIQRLMDGNALDENGADKLRREVDEEFHIYGDSGLKSGEEGDETE